MRKALRLTILVCICLVVVLSAAVFSYADSVPNYTDDYYPCTIIANGRELNTRAALCKGNIYIGIDTLMSLGDMSVLSFDTDDMVCSVNTASLDAFFGDEETTRFIKSNAGTVDLPLKKFSVDFNPSENYYISLGMAANLARLNWTYIDKPSGNTGTVYIRTYSSYSGSIGVASGLETVWTLADCSAVAAPFRENELLTIDTGFSSDSLYKVSDAAGRVFYVSRSELKTAGSASDIYSYSRRYKKKDSYSGPINAMWSEMRTMDNGAKAYCPAKIAGIDVFADISLTIKTGSDGSIRNLTDYGYIQSAHAVGYKWWLCAFDTAVGDKLENRAACARTIAQYLFICSLTNADGINIDYESISRSSRNYFIYFMETLSRHADKLGLTTSVCTYAGTEYNNVGVYPYDIFGQCCDFICQMTYDSTNGYKSVNAKPWYTQRTEYIMSVAPSQKILMGIGYYADCEYSNESEVVGKSTWSNGGIYEMYSDAGSHSSSWNEEYGQPFESMVYPYSRFSYDANTLTINYYIENARSSAQKAKFVTDRNLGGTIGWEYNFMGSDSSEALSIYNAYDDIYNRGGSYENYIY